MPADPAADPFFHTRPSASAEDVLGPGDPSTSGGSNQGGFSEKLLGQVEQRRAAIAAREGVAPEAVPADAVTASASGVDPHISPAYAELQVARVARVTGLPAEQVRALVADATDGRALGFLGEPARERHPAEPRRRGAGPARADDAMAVTTRIRLAPLRRRFADARRAADLPGCGAGGRQDLRHARGGAPPRGPGTDVVVGLVETHSRAKTAALLDDLEVLPRRTVSYRGVRADRAGRRRRARPGPAGRAGRRARAHERPRSRHAKRWQDVDDLLEAGITVLTTVNIQHLESLNDVIERITGVRQQETVPDEVVRRAQQVELVDITPEALRRRMAHGNVYAPEKVDAAMANYFQPRNLTALREMALLWLADQVEVALQRYRTDQQVTDIWETRERVVVALTGGPESETVLRRAARIAERTESAELFAVHVLRGDGLAGAPVGALAGLRRLAEDVGASFHTVVSDDVPDGPARLRPRGRRDPARHRDVAAVPSRPAAGREHRGTGRPGLRAHRRAHGHPRRGRPRDPAARAGSAPSRPAPGRGVGAGPAAAADRRRDRHPRARTARAVHRRRAVLPGHRDQRARRRARPGPARRRRRRAAAQLLLHPADLHLHDRRAGERDHAGGDGAGGGTRRAGRRPGRPAGAAGRAGPGRGGAARVVLAHGAHPRRPAAPAAREDPGGVHPLLGRDPGAPRRPVGGVRVRRPARLHPPRAGGRRRRRRSRHPPRRSRPHLGGRRASPARRRRGPGPARPAQPADRRRRRARPGAAPTPPSCAPRCCRPSATTCAPRWRRSRRRPGACATSGCGCPSTTGPSSPPRSRSRPTG